MTRLAFTLHRVFAAIVFILLVSAAANYYLALGLLGDQRTAKLAMVSLVVLVVVYAGFLMPRLEEIRKQLDAEKSGRIR